MGRPSKTKELNVWMNGELVGKWSQSPLGEHSFAYGENWIESKFARPISLSMPLRPPEIPYRGPKVEAFFDCLLPDNQDIRKRFQNRFGTSSIQAMDLLAEMGRDCIGAIQILGMENKPESNRKIEAIKLKDSDLAIALRSIRTTSQFGEISKDDFRLSLAGAQEKTAFLKMKGKWYRPTGGTPSTHIFKLTMGNRIGKEQVDLSASVQIEWLCSEIVRSFNIPVANCEMAKFEDQEVLIVERFDREWSEDKKFILRLPQEDICQALGIPMGIKYENHGAPGIREILEFLLGSIRSQNDRRVFLKSHILFWFLAAVDGHARNFSVFIGRAGTFSLTPLYDILSAYPVMGRGKNKLAPNKIKMAMSIHRKGSFARKNNQYLWDRMNLPFWNEMGKYCGMENDIQEIISEILDTKNKIVEKIRSNLPNDFPGFIAEPILKGLKSKF